MECSDDDRERGLINDELANRLLGLILEKAKFRKESIYYEIQDDGQCILFLIKINDDSHMETDSTLRNLAEIFDNLVPQRIDDCSWYLSFVKDGEVIDTYFGGNVNSPEMGFPARWHQR